MKLFDHPDRKWHDESLWQVRQNRDTAVKEVPEWEQLRTLASGIKDHTLDHLDQYLLDFESRLKENGVQVHWAGNALEHNEAVHRILHHHQVRTVVKSKSMLTEECGLNAYLESKAIEVIDTDLGERIIQLRNEKPSHIVLPAIHLKKAEIGQTFHREMQTKEGATDAKYLTEAARQDLRKRFLNAGAAISGVNFGIASTGHVIVCTNEGNADMGLNLAPVQIHSMGIEKMIPDMKSLAVFTRLLARSATGQPITVFTSHYQKPKNGGEMHVILVDNGRTGHLAKPDFRNGLKCIRCGACMNTCPVFRRAGGHHFRATIPGPIGSVLMPARDPGKYAELPFASSLCGSCTDVCPVKIDLHDQLYKWRQEITRGNHFPKTKLWQMQLLRYLLSSADTLERTGNFARLALKILPGRVTNNHWNPWTRGRMMPGAPKESFRSWYIKNRKNGA